LVQPDLLECCLLSRWSGADYGGEPIALNVCVGSWQQEDWESRLTTEFRPWSPKADGPQTAKFSSSLGW
jgi:hypothetical protein